MNKHTLAAGIAALVTSLSAAYGATITDSAPISGAVGGPISFVTLDKFNPGLGTLTQIQLTLQTTTTNSSLVFDNESFTIPPFTPGTVGGPSSTITLALGTRITASTGVSLPTIVSANSTTTRTGPITNDTDLPGGPVNPTGAPNFAGIDSLGLLPSTTVNASATTIPPLTSASFLSQFTSAPGATTYLVAISSLFTNPGSLTSNPTGLAGAFNTASQNFSGTVTAIYTFTPVPEASTLLFGAALGLGFAFRRFRTQVA
jgi:hypothetical protein